MTRCNKEIYIPMCFRFNQFPGNVTMHAYFRSDNIFHTGQEYTRTVKSTDR